jgi:DNA-binding winged helix-turn-helix (wHTH) protein
MLEALLRRHPSVVPLEVLKSDMYGHAAVRTNNVERHLVGLRRQLSTHRSAVRIISVTGGGRGLAIEEAPAERRALFRPPSGADFRSPPAQARRARNPT